MKLTNPNDQTKGKKMGPLLGRGGNRGSENLVETKWTKTATKIGKIHKGIIPISGIANVKCPKLETDIVLGPQNYMLASRNIPVDWYQLLNM